MATTKTKLTTAEQATKDANIARMDAAAAAVEPHLNKLVKSMTAEQRAGATMLMQFWSSNRGATYKRLMQMTCAQLKIK